MIRQLVPHWNGRLGYIRKQPNGPASARNAGTLAATTPFVLYHDSDVELPADWITNALVRMREDAELAAVGGYILYAFDPSRVNAYGGDLGRFGLAWDVDEDTPLDPAQGPAQRIWINCSAMLARTEAMRKIDGFEEDFFYGYEDSDIGWRLNLAGHRVSVFPELKARHHVDANPGDAHQQIVFHYCKNRLRSLLRNAESHHLPIMLAAYIGYTLVDLILRPHRLAKIRALHWNLARLDQTLSLRRTTQRQRVTSDRKIFSLGSRRWLPPRPLAGQRRRPVAGAFTQGRNTERSISDDRV